MDRTLLLSKAIANPESLHGGVFAELLTDDAFHELERLF
jgi:hypothetical protein